MILRRIFFDMVGSHLRLRSVATAFDRHFSEKGLYTATAGGAGKLSPFAVRHRRRRSASFLPAHHISAFFLTDQAVT